MAQLCNSTNKSLTPKPNFKRKMHIHAHLMMYFLAHLGCTAWFLMCPLEGAFCYFLEKCLSLLGCHALTGLQKIGHYQRLLNSLRFHPHSSIQPNHHLKRENLFQVLHYFTLWSQKSEEKENTCILAVRLFKSQGKFILK